LGFDGWIMDFSTVAASPPSHHCYHPLSLPPLPPQQRQQQQQEQQQEQQQQCNCSCNPIDRFTSDGLIP